MKINKSVKKNFETMCKAVIADDVCIMDAREIRTGKSVVLVCAVNKTGKEYEFVPIAVMIDGNPYEMYEPPNTEGGYAMDNNTQRKGLH